MKRIVRKIRFKALKDNKGMELVQVGILIAIAIILGLIFKSELVSFINKTFDNLDGGF